MLNLEKEERKIHKMKKAFNYMMGNQINFILEEINPIRKKKHEQTWYYFFKCRVITKNNKQIPPGKHTIQLPGKTVVYQLYHLLKDKDRLNDKNIPITIIKKDNKNYDITIHS